MREMHNLWKICSLAWAYSIKAYIVISTGSIVISKFKTISIIITNIIKNFWPEGYCYYLDFLRMVYYPVTNHFIRANNGPRFATILRTKTSMLGHNEALQLTGFSMYQLELLFKHLRIPDALSEPHCHKFVGEEVFLHYMIYNWLGDTKLRMSQNYFGGDPRRFTILFG